MDAAANTPPVYIEHVEGLGAEQQSLYLARHLPRRLSAGSVIIVHDRPSILLAVIRKRWMLIIKEIERERASTLDHAKRQQLDRELAHMRGWRFGIEVSTLDRIEALILKPEDIIGSALQCFTLYTTIPLEPGQKLALQTHIRQNGLFVIFE